MEQAVDNFTGWRARRNLQDVATMSGFRSTSVLARFGINICICSCFVMASSSYAQPVQYQFTPPPPIPTLPSSPAPFYPPMPGVARPVPAPGHSHLAPYRVTPPPGLSPQRSARPVQTARGRTILVPSSPGDTFGDRVSTCAHAGAAAGLRPNQLSAFMGQCVN